MRSLGRQFDLHSHVLIQEVSEDVLKVEETIESYFQFIKLVYLIVCWWDCLWIGEVYLKLYVIGSGFETFPPEIVIFSLTVFEHDWINWNAEERHFDSIYNNIGFRDNFASWIFSLLGGIKWVKWEDILQRQKTLVKSYLEFSSLTYGRCIYFYWILRVFKENCDKIEIKRNFAGFVNK